MAFTLKSVLKGLGKAAKMAAPVAGFALGPAAGIGLGLAGGLGHGKKSLKKMALGAATGGAGAVAGKLAGVSKLGVLGGARNAASTLGSGIKKLGGAAASGAGALGKAATMTGGELDIQKLLGLGMAGSGFLGARKDQAATNKYNAANAEMRNALMAKLAAPTDSSALMNAITKRPNYTF